MKISEFHYFNACAAFWSVCAMWYDLQEMLPKFEIPEVFMPALHSDKLATISLDLAWDAIEFLDLPYARTIEEFADTWLVKWLPLLEEKANQITLLSAVLNDYMGNLHYLYFGFLSQIARKFCQLTPSKIEIETTHQLKCPSILKLAGEIEQVIEDFELQHNEEVKLVNILREQKENFSLMLSESWERAIFENV